VAVINTANRENCLIVVNGKTIRGRNGNVCRIKWEQCIQLGEKECSDICSTETYIE
jgi:hypothetical protein